MAINPPPPGQATYDYAQLEGLWEEAGGPKALAPLMAAIAMAESGGRADAHNPSGASGLWQILGAPTGWHGSTDWFNPEINADAAVAKYKTQGLSAWTTYTSGAYKQFLKGNVPPNLKTGKTWSSGGGADVNWHTFADTAAGGLFGVLGEASGLKAVTEAIGVVGKDLEGVYNIATWLALPSNWVRIFAGIFGAALLGAGVYLVGKEARAS